MGNLVKMLVYFGQRKLASTLQSKFDEFCELVKSKLHLLVLSKPPTADTNDNNEKSSAGQNKDNIPANDSDQQTNSLLPTVNWKLSLFG
jgi:hypothetical protein